MDFLHDSGLLGTPASLGADISLLVTTLAAILVTIGWRLAVQKRFTAHHWVQTSATILNALVAVFWMVGSFRRYVAPDLPGNLADPPFALTAVHAAVGTIGLVLAGLIILRYGFLSPPQLRRVNAKAVMRTAFILYLLAWLLGVAVYVVLYGGF